MLIEELSRATIMNHRLQDLIDTNNIRYERKLKEREAEYQGRVKALLKANMKVKTEQKKTAALTESHKTCLGKMKEREVDYQSKLKQQEVESQGKVRKVEAALSKVETDLIVHQSEVKELKAALKRAEELEAEYLEAEEQNMKQQKAEHQEEMEEQKAEHQEEMEEKKAEHQEKLKEREAEHQEKMKEQKAEHREREAEYQGKVKQLEDDVAELVTFHKDLDKALLKCREKVEKQDATILENEGKMKEKDDALVELQKQKKVTLIESHKNTAAVTEAQSRVKQLEIASSSLQASLKVVVNAFSVKSIEEVVQRELKRKRYDDVLKRHDDDLKGHHDVQKRLRTDVDTTRTDVDTTCTRIDNIFNVLKEHEDVHKGLRTDIISDGASAPEKQDTDKTICASAPEKKEKKDTGKSILSFFG
jgi:DNA repair exonuclease SbcCD ATPase subunit